MSFAFFASHYLSLSFSLLSAFVIAVIVFLVNQKWNHLRFSDELKLHYALLTMPIAIVALKVFLPAKNFFQPIAKVWTANSFKEFSTSYSESIHRGFVSFHPQIVPLDIESVITATFAVAVGAFLIWSGIFVKDLYKLRKILASTYLYKRIKGLSIEISDTVLVPFSFWVPGKSGVVLPVFMLANREEQRISLKHEIQHHRQRDTQWIYLIWMYRILFFWNPVIFVWNKLISEVQEFACDEALVDQKRVSSQAYADCLLQVAKRAQGQSGGLACATGLLFLTDESLLKRRIIKMFQSKQKKRSYTLTLATFAFCIVAGVAAASNQLIQDRRISLSEAQAMSKIANQGSEFPIVVNDLVLKQLNRYVGTPEGRDFMKNSLARMENHKAFILAKLEEYQVPSELLAVPIVESGFRNLSQSPNQRHGAGLWMFIKSTARNFGLRVDDEVDERLNIELETDAAMRYLSSENLRFKSWELALLAYNIGGKAVQQGIDKIGSRDAWALVRAGVENDKDYLPRVIAAMIIMKNPRSIE